MSPLKIDHVTLAGPDLSRMQDAFATFGFATEYGGPHSNGITHMSQLGFDDGSYIELISTLAPWTQSPWWHAHIAGNAGPCGWAIEVPDVAAECAQLRACGQEVRGPIAMSRRRPDGAILEWDLAFIGEGEPGTVLPFIIKDRTPRFLRVRPSTSVSASELTGIAGICLCVQEVARTAALFNRCYGATPSAEFTIEQIAARAVHLVDTPVYLMSPASPGTSLAHRLAQFGECPCAYLIGSTDFAHTAARFNLSESMHWQSRRVAWFDSGKLENIGVISSTS